MVLLQISLFYTLESCAVTALPLECLSALMNIVKLLEMNLIVTLACVSKGTWYLTCLHYYHDFVNLLHLR